MRTARQIRSIEVMGSAVGVFSGAYRQISGADRI